MIASPRSAGTREIGDPMSFDTPLPLNARYYPAGYALDLATNSPEVAATADRLWSRYPRLSDGPAVQLRVAVSDVDAVTDFRPCVPRGHAHLVTMAHGAENFAVCDLAQCVSFAALTRDVATDDSYLATWFLDPLASFMLASRYFALAHASCVAWEGQAVLLCGDSGSGKTCLAYACGRLGWSFLSGDATQIVRDSGHHTVIGRPFAIRFRETARRLFPELRDYPVSVGPAGKLDIEADAQDLGLTLAFQAPAKRLVFLDRVEGSRAALETISFEEAWDRLRDVLFIGPDWLRKAHSDALIHLLEVPSVRLRYSDFTDAERALRSLLSAQA